VTELREVSIGRNARVSAVAAGATGLVAAAYFVRAAGGGSLVDWLVFAGLGALTLAHLHSLRDARTPLFVADELGVRVRSGRTWRGIPWDELDEVEHLPRRGLLRDGRLILFPRDQAQHVATPLGLVTTVSGAEGDLTAALAGLAGERCDIVEIVPAPPEDLEDPEDLQDRASDDDTAETPPVLASPTPSPLREPVTAMRAELAEGEDPDATVLTTVAHLDVHDTGAWHASTVLIDDLADVPIVDPVIGPQLRAARERLRLSIDQLAERTRIRPHVIEALEIDDFVPCGGDFYARGHLRTLARILGLDSAPLLETYAERYADAPVDPRRVFAAELATGRSGPLKGTRGGPNWSVLVAAVMAVVLVWSVARLVMDNPVSLTPASPSLANGSAGLTGGREELAPQVDVLLNAAGGGAHVVVRDGGGRVVFKDSIAFGATQALKVSPPVRVQSSDGSLEVTVDGQAHGALGETGRTAQDVFTAR
jgi:cytoskeleton protein RodZ